MKKVIRKVPLEIVRKTEKSFFVEQQPVLKALKMSRKAIYLKIKQK